MFKTLAVILAIGLVASPVVQGHASADPWWTEGNPCTDCQATPGGSAWCCTLENYCHPFCYGSDIFVPNPDPLKEKCITNVLTCDKTCNQPIGGVGTCSGKFWNDCQQYCPPEQTLDIKTNTCTKEDTCPGCLAKSPVNGFVECNWGTCTQKCYHYNEVPVYQTWGVFTGKYKCVPKEQPTGVWGQQQARATAAAKRYAAFQVCAKGESSCGLVDGGSECVKLQSSLHNCGACGNDCTQMAGTSSVRCTAGQCVANKCSTGFHLGNGTCTDYSE